MICLSSVIKCQLTFKGRITVAESVATHCAELKSAENFRRESVEHLAKSLDLVDADMGWKTRRKRRGEKPVMKRKVGITSRTLYCVKVIIISMIVRVWHVYHFPFGGIVKDNRNVKTRKTTISHVTSPLLLKIVPYKKRYTAMVCKISSC